MADDQSNIIITPHRRSQMDPGQPLHKYRDAFCFECGSTDHEFKLLLCDMCDGAYHLLCARPMLFRVPNGPWYCTSCAHLSRPLKRSYKLKKCRARLQQLRLRAGMKKFKREHE
ncbi:Zinc finger, FYVE/PHD-type, partial [Cynara cardunculus var. scolymus]